MAKLRVGVIGTGYLGKFHAEKYARLPDVVLTALCDIDSRCCQLLATQFNTHAFSDYRDLLGKVDAVSIVVPTPLHFSIAQFFLENGVHVLLEKPMTTTLTEADTLIKTAKQNHSVLQIGHLERFNPVIIALKEKITAPLFMESIRVAPFQPRGTEVNVILDLMIHDIDLLQTLANSPIRDIRAAGAPVLSPQNDIISARIEFDNNCVANVTASRISFKVDRRLRIFQHDSYCSADLQRKALAIFHKGTGEMFPGVPEVLKEEFSFPDSDALLAEIKSFVNAILTGTKPMVSGAEGRRALATAMDITQKVNDYLKRVLGTVE